MRIVTTAAGTFLVLEGIVDNFLFRYALVAAVTKFRTCFGVCEFVKGIIVLLVARVATSIRHKTFCIDGRGDNYCGGVRKNIA